MFFSIFVLGPLFLICFFLSGKRLRNFFSIDSKKLVIWVSIFLFIPFPVTNFLCRGFSSVGTALLTELFENRFDGGVSIMSLIFSLPYLIGDFFIANVLITFLQYISRGKSYGMSWWQVSSVVVVMVILFIFGKIFLHFSC